jgi:hypothetical protein
MPRPLLGSPAPVEMIDPYGYDPDATRYIRAVEAADRARLEVGVRAAINAFVVGCKADNIWNAIRASCILCGARTLAGALVPLAGTAPTNFNFVAGDYNRKTGLVGDGSTKFLNSNRSGGADPLDNMHASIFISQPNTIVNSQRYLEQGGFFTEGFSQIAGSTTTLRFSSRRASTNNVISFTCAPAFVGMSRQQSSNYTVRVCAQNSTVTTASQALANTANWTVLGTASYSNARLAFYSIGESIDLALLDARVTALMTSLGAAI